MRFLFVVLFVCILSHPCLSATLNVPNQYASIQEAIDASANGDQVLVAAGTYYENIIFKGKIIEVKSVAGPKTTIIHGSGLGSCVCFVTSETNAAMLDGFTLTGGTGKAVGTNNRGGAIYMVNASPTIKNNIIQGNSADHGGGIYCTFNSKAVIQSNHFENNSASLEGGGIYCDNAFPLIRDNTIRGNFASMGAGVRCAGGSATIESNVILENSSTCTGGGLYCYATAHTLTNNLIVHNSAGTSGGGLWADGGSILMNNTISGNNALAGGGLDCSISAFLVNCIVWDNSATPGLEEISGNGVKVKYSNVKGGYPGKGNIDADPLFFDPSFFDYHLKQDPCQPGLINPCVDAGSELATSLGFSWSWTRTDGVCDSGVIDMGYHYGEYPKLTESLTANAASISQSAGGLVNFSLDAGSGNSNRSYLIFCGVTGTSPGFNPPPGLVNIPVNWDLFTNLALQLTNTSVFSNFYGILDSKGQAQATFNTLGPFTGGAGLTINFAFGTELQYWDFASNPVSIDIVP